MSKIVKTAVFMVSGNDFGIVNKVYIEFFAGFLTRSLSQLTEAGGL
jgi:enamine deaminase RidA (YjgF/YER057c/UK114 family)